MEIKHGQAEIEGKDVVIASIKNEYRLGVVRNASTGTDNEFVVDTRHGESFCRRKNLTLIFRPRRDERIGNYQELLAYLTEHSLTSTVRMMLFLFREIENMRDFTGQTRAIIEGH